MVYWSNPYKTEVMITPVLEMLKLPKFGHILTSTITFESRDQTLLEALMTLKRLNELEITY